MKLQRSTIIFIFGALLMGAAFYYYETLIIPGQESKELFANKLFKIQEEDVRSLLVKTNRKTIRFDRVLDVSAPTDLWYMEILEFRADTTSEKANPEERSSSAEKTEEFGAGIENYEEYEEYSVTPEETEYIGAEIENPEEAVTTEEEITEENTNFDELPEISREKTYANEAYVSFLLEQLVSGRSKKNLTGSLEKRKEYELNPPIATIEITMNNGEIHKLILGKSEFSGNYIYAQVNPPTPDTENQTVMLVSKNFEYAVDRSLEEWQQPAIPEEYLEEARDELSEENSQTLEETLEENSGWENPEKYEDLEPNDSEETPDSDEESPEINYPENTQ